jgi:histidinol-phosphate aminotransferase
MKKILNVKKMIRPSCAGFEPYVAGRPVETIKRELGLKKVIKLASNENPLGPSPKAVTAMRKAAERIYFYPDSNSWELKQAVAKKFSVDSKSVVLGAGSDEIIELIGKAFFRPQDEIVVSEHAFVRYRMAADLMGSKTIAVPMKNYTHDLNAMRAAVTPRTKAIFIANPNNPTGTYNTAAEIEKFLKKLVAEWRGGSDTVPLVVIDEAYYEYASMLKDYPDTRAYLKKYPNLILTRTFSKIYGLAGLRIGYAFSSPEIVDYLDRIRPPFNINLAAQAAAVASLDDPDQVKKGVRLNAEQKKVLYTAFDAMGLQCLPSAGNFVLVNVSPMKGNDVFKQMLRKGVIVRAMDEYNLHDFVRITIGTPAENKMMLAALKAVLSGK